MTVIDPTEPLTVGVLKVLLTEKDNDMVVLFDKDGTKVELRSGWGANTQQAVLKEAD